MSCERQSSSATLECRLGGTASGRSLRKSRRPSGDCLRLPLPSLSTPLEMAATSSLHTLRRSIFTGYASCFFSDYHPPDPAIPQQGFAGREAVGSGLRVPPASIRPSSATDFSLAMLQCRG